MGDWSYGPSGEWTKSGMMQVQYHGIKEGAGLETWKGMSYQTVLTPADLKTGNVIYPYEKAYSNSAALPVKNGAGQIPRRFVFEISRCLTSPYKTGEPDRCC